ncbi:hypothetical protein Tco_0452347 [Tanacetum coccineum]
MGFGGISIVCLTTELEEHLVLDPKPMKPIIKTLKVSKAADNKGGGGTGKSGKQTRYSTHLLGDSSNDLSTHDESFEGDVQNVENESNTLNKNNMEEPLCPNVIVTGLSHGDVHEGEIQGDKTESTKAASGSSNVVHHTDKVLMEELNIVKEPTNVNSSLKIT